ncbi:SH3 domain-containing protein [Acinetobacter gyllenbergii]|uniref:SH3 domain-containing protein n=1 Tax=Acinetobacter gyllenbergii TaxID=134534 RepID=UPI000806B96C|nr:SH3 domain-containing protein [Acinetobacter gyllenbergii]OBY75263.1 hypothetical protein NG55_00870 [Acinetobacter gyllenbergii]
MKNSAIGWGAAGVLAIIFLGSGNEDSSVKSSNTDASQNSSEEIIDSQYIKTNALNIRDKPNGSVVGKLGRGDKVDIYEKQGSWVRISLNSKSPQWVSSKLLCQSDGCFEQKSPKSKSTNYQALSSQSEYKERKQEKTYYDSDCSCSVVDYCVGPRGGHYCITSGGNKRYK